MRFQSMHSSKYWFRALQRLFCYSELYPFLLHLPSKQLSTSAHLISLAIHVYDLAAQEFQPHIMQLVAMLLLFLSAIIYWYSSSINSCDLLHIRCLLALLLDLKFHRSEITSFFNCIGSWDNIAIDKGEDLYSLCMLLFSRTVYLQFIY